MVATRESGIHPFVLPKHDEVSAIVVVLTYDIGTDNHSAGMVRKGKPFSGVWPRRIALHSSGISKRSDYVWSGAVVFLPLTVAHSTRHIRSTTLLFGQACALAFRNTH